MQSDSTSSTSLEFMDRSVRGLTLPLNQIVLLDMTRCSFLSENSNHYKLNYQ